MHPKSKQDEAEEQGGGDIDYLDGSSNRPDEYDDKDIFGHEENHDIKYKTLSWQGVAFIMIAEIASSGILSLPSALAAVGMVPGIILIIFLGVFATYTAWLLVEFKLRHPEVHNMGDAGYILFGPIGREILSFGTICFAIFAVGGQMLVGAEALSSLSNGKLCSMLYTGIWAIATLIVAIPRTFDGLHWVSFSSCVSIFIACLVGMIGAGIVPIPDRLVQATVQTDFVTAFSAITNPVYAYAGHFMFFLLVSEMKKPQQAMRAAYTLQGFTTTYYAIFAAVSYGFLGSMVSSPSFSSLSITWQKVAFGLSIPNLLFAGSLYLHTAAKVIFMRLFRNSHHKHNHTILGWTVWLSLLVLGTGVAFVLAVGIPIFNYIVSIAASLFAAWFTYGIGGMFWLHDAYYYKGGVSAWRRGYIHTILCIFTILIGGLICVAGLYISIVGIKEAYEQSKVGSPFTC